MKEDKELRIECIFLCVLASQTALVCSDVLSETFKTQFYFPNIRSQGSIGNVFFLNNSTAFLT